MKFLVDENLPPRLAVWLCDQGHDAVHVQRAGLVGHDDADIIRRALAEDRIILTKDNDFQDGAARVIQLAIGNMSTSGLLGWVSQRWPSIEAPAQAGVAKITID